MRFKVDTHVHLYPVYRLAQALDALIDNLAAAADEVAVGCLTERHDCFVFDQLAAGASPLDDRFEVSPPDGVLLRLRRRADGATCYLVAGQQIITAENIEVLALGMRDRLPDGQDAAATVSAVRAAGAVPVVAWAPGKWFGGRGKVVRDLLRRFQPGDLALGDTTLRPHGWATPFIMRAAHARGFCVLAGSDPLPHAGEECRPGSYHSVIEADLPLSQLVEQLAHLPPPSIAAGGSRGMPWTVAQRLRAHGAAKKS